MSNRILWDSLLVRALARELHEHFAGHRLADLRFDRDPRLLALRSGRLELRWDLHPDRGALRVAAAGKRWRGNLTVPAGTRIERVHAPPDERIVIFDLLAEDPAATPAPSRLVIELIPPALNAVAVGGGETILAVLRPRDRGRRPLVAGALYEPPRRSVRHGALEPIGPAEWLARLGVAEPGERARVLVASVAYTSPLNAPHVLGPAAAAEGAEDAEGRTRLLAAAYSRYRGLMDTAGHEPCTLHTPDGPQPYPAPLSNLSSVTRSSLLDAFAQLPEAPDEPQRGGDRRALALERLDTRLERLDSRVFRLREELNGAAIEADTLRRQADLLLTQLHRAERGAAEVELDDFSGGTVRVPLDPALGGAQNANRLYEQARRRDRAARRLPAMVGKAERRAQQMRELRRRIESGEAAPEELGAPTPRKRGHRRAATERLPYRTYRTTGGLEVRVGRSGAANDELTFHHSAPDDIWLHARDTAGAHVVLRWTDRDANPPESELVQAAVLAAQHSRARTSRTVPVDWTRRKYVRKPRRSKPGVVVIERAKTLFVEMGEVDLPRR